MKRLVGFLAAITALLGASLFHTFYTDCRTATSQPTERLFLVSWEAPDNLQDIFIHKFAETKANSYTVQYSSRPLPGLNNKSIPYSYRENFNGESKTVQGQIFRTNVPDATPTQARQLAKYYLDTHPLRQGIAPSRNTSDSDDISQAAMARALWFGVIFPILLVFISLSLIAVSVRKVQR